MDIKEILLREYEEIFQDLMDRNFSDIQDKRDVMPWIHANRSFLNESEISINYGCTRVVIRAGDDDWVIKVDLPAHTGFCKAEYEVYKKARDNGYGEMFAEMFYLGKLYGYELYAMEYAEPDADNFSSFCGRSNYWDEEEDAVFDVFCNCYELECEDLDEIWYDILDLTDLHSGNCGWRYPDKPVLIDYCTTKAWRGFDE